MIENGLLIGLDGPVLSLRVYLKYIGGVYLKYIGGVYLKYIGGAFLTITPVTPMEITRYESI